MMLGSSRGLARAMVLSQHRRLFRGPVKTALIPRLDADVKSLDPATRNRELTTWQYNAKKAQLAAPGCGRCSRCWLVKNFCVCAYADGSGIVEGAVTTPLPPMPHRILVYMHVKEFTRGSNTGALAACAFPDQTTIFVAGVPEQEEAFQAALDASAGSCFVLFPSEKGYPANTLLSRALTPFVFEPEAFTIIVVDGTWSQATKLAKRIPSGIPRIGLDEAELLKLGSDQSRSAFLSPMRQMPQADRVCSLTALVLLLRDLKVDARLGDVLLDLLTRKSYAVRGHNPWKEATLSPPEGRPAKIQESKVTLYSTNRVQSSSKASNDKVPADPFPRERDTI